MEDLQKFIDINGIKTITELRRDYQGLIVRIKTKDPNFNHKNLKFELNLKKDWSDYNLLSDFQKFIDENNIKNITELKINYSGLYKRFKDLGFQTNQLKNIYIQRNWSDLTTLKDFQDYIDNNPKIKKLSQFKKLNRGRLRFLELGLYFNDLKFDLPTKSRRNWEKYDSLEKIQKFIDDNSILTSSIFTRDYEGLFLKSKKLGIFKKLKFPKKFKSRLELEIEKFLIANNINFISQKVFKDISNLKFDFYLPDYNIILEPGGEQHFIPIKRWGGEEKFKRYQKYDLMKYNYCLNNGITILYYFRFGDKSVYSILENNGYMGEWYKDFNEFKNKILKIIKDKKGRKEN